MSSARKALIGFLGFLLFGALTGLGLAHTARQTVLNPDFVNSELESLEVATLVDDLLRQQLPDEVIKFLPEGFIDEAVSEVLTEMEPWLREQLATAVDAGYDYLWGRTDRFSLLIDITPVKEDISVRVREAILADPPEVLNLIPPDELGQLFDQLYGQIADQIPATIEVNESVLNAVNPDIMTMLNQARRYVSYFRIIYPALIVATALLIMGIILLARRDGSAPLWLGIPILISGVVSYVFPVVVRHFTDPMLTASELPPALDAWLPGFINNALAPIRIYGIVLIVVGVALLIAAAVRRHRTDY